MASTAAIRLRLLRLGFFGLAAALMAATAPPVEAQTILHVFNQTDGTAPGRLVSGPDGRLYGTTFYGGDHDKGTAFVIAPDGTFTSLHSFSGPDGFNPMGALALFSDGNFYGVVYSGGFFSLSPGGSFTAVPITDNLDAPAGTLTDGGDGNLYGITWKNELARYSPAGAIQVVHSFQPSEGSWPGRALTLGSDGKLYGTLYGNAQGESFSGGALYRSTQDGRVDVLYQFDSALLTSLQPGLTESPAGTFYGVTALGGAQSVGTVFRVTSGGSFTTLYTFDGKAAALPVDRLALGPDGNLYGTTTPTTQTNATIFRVTPAGAVTVLALLDVSLGESSAPVFGSDGMLYGTSLGNSPNTGIVYRFDALTPQPPQLVMRKLCKAGTPCSDRVRVGSSYRVFWQTANVGSCRASGAWNGARQSSGGVRFTATASGTYVYRLACSGPTGGVQSSVTITVV